MTIFALSSAAGQSGIAVIRISGPDTGEIIKLMTNSELPTPRKGEVVGYAVIELEGESLTTIKLHSMEDVSEGSFYRKTLDSILRSF